MDRWPRTGVHTPEGSWSPSQKRYVPRSTLPVYERQPFPETVLGSGAAEPLKSGTELFKNDEIRVWTLDDEIAIASITAKLHLISPAVIEGLSQALRDRRRQVQGAGDLVARRRVLGRRQPRIADAGVHEERLQGHRARGEEAAGLHAAPALCAGAGGERDARHRAGRRLRAGAVQRAARRAHGNLRRPGRGRRRPGARRRRPGGDRAQGRRGSSVGAWHRPAGLHPTSRSPPPRWPRWAPARSKAARSATCKATT